MNSDSNTRPEISVLMAVYNGEKFVKGAIDSILRQTYKNFELIIINDGSTDMTRDIVLSYIDKRIIYLENCENKGIAYTLNTGLDAAKGKYIAIMDADDFSEDSRLSLQYKFLENNPEIGCCGGWMDIIDCDGEPKGPMQYPTSSNVISCLLLFFCCIGNPSVCYRKTIIQDIGYYNLEFRSAMDYDLWTRMIGKYKFANIPQTLVKYRIHGNNISGNREKNIQQDYLIRKKAIETLLGQTFSPELDTAFQEWLNNFPSKNQNDLFLITSLLSRILRTYVTKTRLDFHELKEINDFFSVQLLNLALIANNISIFDGMKIIVKGLQYGPYNLLPYTVDLKKRIFHK